MRAPRWRWAGLLAIGTVVGASACATDGADPAPQAGYRPVADRLSAFIRRELADKAVPAVSLALVDDQEIVWSSGFGVADPERRTQATGGTVYRVGAVSALFTALAVMQQVDEGALALDSPVTSYVPEFAPANPFGTAITLRHLLAHRAGVVREPPVGHSLDPGGPELDSVVISLARSALVHAPGSTARYSNAGLAVAGLVVQRVTGTPFGAHLQRRVLAPLGMTSSSFAADPAQDERRARGMLWSYGGDRWPAPDPAMGAAPAVGLSASVTDLAWVLTAVFAHGLGVDGAVVSDSSLAGMLRPQAGDTTAWEGYGLGVALGALDGERTVGLSGTVSGNATHVLILPAQRLGVVVAAPLDAATAVVTRIAEYALRMMRARRAGRPLPPPERTRPVPDSLLTRLPGRYRAGDQAVTIERWSEGLWGWFRQPGLRARLRTRGDTLVADDRHWYGTRLRPVPGGLVVNGVTLVRVPDGPPRRAPARWQVLIGEYGWEHGTLTLLERDGELTALVDRLFLYPLTAAGRDRYAVPAGGRFDGEYLEVARDAAGAVSAVVLGGVRFPRRPDPGAEGGFRIPLSRPVDSLRAEALAATPPPDSGSVPTDLVELKGLDPTILYDIRYAGSDNFMGTPFYDTAQAYLQREAAEALVRVHRRLAAQGVGLLIHDAYRPWYVTKMFWDATPDSQKVFVADPSRGSRHNRGAAVDLTLYDRRTGRPVEMVSGYDEFSPRAAAQYPGGTSLQRWHRDVLRAAMEAEGFTVYRHEWWHFDFRDWQRYPIMNLGFADLAVPLGVSSP